MSDPLSTAAGIVGLVAFAIESSKALYTVIENVKSYGKTIRELREETRSLWDVLVSLQDTLAASNVDFASLEIPLQSCGRLCQECSMLVAKCTSRTTTGKFSVRDFLTLTYKGKNIVELRSLMAVHKSTVTIALADANLRQVTITTNLLREYTHTIEQTKSDLNELLQSYDEVREERLTRDDDEIADLCNGESDEDAEKMSIQACLDICAKVFDHIEEMQKEAGLGSSDLMKQNADLVNLNAVQARRITSQRLHSCQTEINLTSAELRLRLQDIDSRLARLHRPASAERDSRDSQDSEAFASNSSTVQKELDSIRQCLSICQEATEEASSERINIFEDIKMADDGRQLIVSTLGDLISAKRVTAGSRSVQLLGQMSDASLQQYSVMPSSSLNVGSKLDRSRFEDKVSSEDPLRTQFSGRYGVGQRLSK